MVQNGFDHMITTQDLSCINSVLLLKTIIANVVFYMTGSHAEGRSFRILERL